MAQPVTRLADIGGMYDAIFVDLWGCLHNGVEPFPEAIEALRAFKAAGGMVLLLTNSPRPQTSVRRQLARIGVPEDIWHGIASSGDAAQEALMAGMVGRKVYHLGPERDLSFFNDLPEHLRDKPAIERVPMSEAEGIVCTGLFDDLVETPDDYRLTILDGVNRGLKMLCTNPDISVDLGDKRIFCAGAIAKAYEEAGGESLYFGKPYSPVYELARRRLAAHTGFDIAEDRILCIGDGINTDIRGAMAQGMDSLFLTGGLAADEIPSRNGVPDATKLEAFAKEHRLDPTYVMEKLR